MRINVEACVKIVWHLLSDLQMTYSIYNLVYRSRHCFQIFEQMNEVPVKSTPDFPKTASRAQD